MAVYHHVSIFKYSFYHIICIIKCSNNFSPFFSTLFLLILHRLFLFYHLMFCFSDFPNNPFLL
jgi:hypothetical protein